MEAKNLYQYAVWLLGRRDYATQEMKQRLSRKIYEKQQESPTEEGVLESVIQKLLDNQYLDDERCISLFAQSYVRKGYGPIRVKMSLREKGFDAEMIERTLSVLEVDWFANAEEVYKKKFGECKPADYKEKQKQVRYLLYKGFTSDIIYELF